MLLLDLTMAVTVLDISLIQDPVYCDFGEQSAGHFSTFYMCLPTSESL